MRCRVIIELMDENKNQPIVPPSPPSSLPPPNLPSVSPALIKPPAPPVSPPTTRPEMKPTEPTPVQKSVPGFSSSIRTMQQDVEAILKGKEPAGTSIEKKMEGSFGQPPPPPPPLPPAPLAKSPIVKLGETEKAKPLTPTPIFPPFLPKPPQSKISAPLPKPSAAITVPSKKPVSRMFLLLLVLFIAIGGFLYWFLTIRQKPPVAKVTPTPTAFPTKTPPRAENLLIPLVGDPLVQAFPVIVNNIEIEPGILKALNIVDESGKGYTFSGLLNRSEVSFPQPVIDKLNIDKFIFLFYGQTESFAEVALEKKYGFVVEINPGIDLTQDLLDWESIMATDLDNLLNFNSTKAQINEFQDNIREGTNIRYMNFPNPDKTIDYAIITAANGKKYFILMNSRESMYSAIDNFDLLISPLF